MDRRGKPRHHKRVRGTGKDEEAWRNGQEVGSRIKVVEKRGFAAQERVGEGVMEVENAARKGGDRPVRGRIGGEFDVFGGDVHVSVFVGCVYHFQRAISVKGIDDVIQGAFVEDGLPIPFSFKRFHLRIN